MARKKYEVGWGDFDKELEYSAKMHAEVEWWCEKMSHRTTPMKIAKCIREEYGDKTLLKIIEDRIMKLEEVSENEITKDLTSEEILKKLEGRELSKIIPGEELIGGLVQIKDYPEVRDFLRRTKLFRTISDMFGG